MIFCEVICSTGETLRIAVDQTRFKLSDVAFVDGAATHRTMLVVAWHAIIDENESRCVRKPASGKTQIGAHSGPQSARSRLTCLFMQLRT